MVNISFDKRRHAYITINNIGSDISFLMDPVFNNSESSLRRDIELCKDEDMKNILISFYDFIKSSGLKEDDDDNIIEGEISLEFKSGELGNWCAVVHNIKADHSGYWYAAQNLAEEKRSLIRLRHELEGIKIAVENINNVITSIKSAGSIDDATFMLAELGIDELQAKAVLRMNINSLVCCDAYTISEKIAQCEKWEEFINNCQ